MNRFPTRALLIRVVVATLAFAGRLAFAADGVERRPPLRDRGVVLTPEDARAIASTAEGFVDLSYLTTLSPAVARILATSKCSLDLSGLRDLPVELASALAPLRDGQIILDGLETISAESLRTIAGGDLQAVWLGGVREMPEAVFAELLQAKATVACGLEKLPPTAATLLAARCPPRVWWHRLNEISDAQLEAIVDRAATIVLGLRSLTPRQADLLSRCQERLILDSVTTLDAETARLLTQRKGKGTISLRGLRSLADDAKACLESHGEVSYRLPSRPPPAESTDRAEAAAAILGCGLRSALQAHALAESLSRTAMAGGASSDEVAGLVGRAIKGFEAVDIPVLRKHGAEAGGQSTVGKAFVATEALQRHVLAELQVAQALAKTRAGDEARDAFGDLVMKYDAVRIACQSGFWDVRALAEATASPVQVRPEDTAVVAALAFQEAANAHLLAESLLYLLRSEPPDDVAARCDKAITNWLSGTIPAFHRYRGRVEDGHQDADLLDAIMPLQDCVLAELRAVGACAAAGRLDRRTLAPFVEANQAYDNVGRPVATRIARRLGAGSTGAAGQGVEPGGPDARAFSEEEWGGVVALLRQQGLVRTAEEARVYSGTFALLKGVFVENRIPEPSPRQLFALAKTLNVAFGQMAPDRIETTLRAMLQLAKETGTAVASRDDLLSLGE